MPDHFYSLVGQVPPTYQQEGTSCVVFAHDQPEVNTVGVYRYFSSRSGDHYYTTDKGTGNHIIMNQGYVIENSGKAEFYVFDRPVDNVTVPFYQWLIGTDHFYTTHSTGELAPWVGGQYQGILGYVFPSDTSIVGSRHPLHRYYKR